jgi:hypothetical protein
MDTAKLYEGHRELAALARAGGFGPPPPGEWTAQQVLAHVACADTAIASVTLRVAAGERPGYDNRPSLDVVNLARIIADAGDLAGLADLVEQRGELLTAAARALSPADRTVLVPVLIVSGEQLVVDEPWSMEDLVIGVGTFHLPRHADQLAALR